MRMNTDWATLGTSQEHERVSITAWTRRNSHERQLRLEDFYSGQSRL